LPLRFLEGFDQLAKADAGELLIVFGKDAGDLGVATRTTGISVS